MTVLMKVEQETTNEGIFIEIESVCGRAKLWTRFWERKQYGRYVVEEGGDVGSEFLPRDAL